MTSDFDHLVSLLWSDERIGAVGPYTNYSDYFQKLAGCTYQNYVELEQFVKSLIKAVRGEQSQVVLLLGDFCLCVKRSVWEQVDGFDVGYEGASYFADADLSLRLLEAGYRLLVDKCAYVHQESLQWQDLNSTFAEENTKGRAYFEEKWKFKIDYTCSIRQPLLKHVDITKKSLAVLEAGCACGGNLMYLKQANPTSELYGIELDEHTARIASCFGQIFNLDLEKFSKPEWQAKFDVIIMGDILEHLFDPWKTVRNMYEITKQSGRIIISVPNIMHLSVFYSMLHGRWAYQDSGIFDRTHLRFFTKFEAIQLLEQAGYDVVSVEYSQVDVAEPLRQLYPKLINILGYNIDAEQLEAYQWILVGERR